MKCLFKGTAVAMVTPFKNGQVDYQALEGLIENDLTQGAKAIVLLGTTGEGATIKEKEREKMIRFAKKVIGNRCKLIVGTGHNDFDKAYSNTVMAKRLGADGALVVTPYYNKTTQKGLVEYYSKLAEIGLPIIMYNVPSRTGLCIDVDTVKKLAKVKNVVGIKESTNDIERIIKLAKVCNGKIALYSGEDFLNYVFYCLGASGCVSVSANAFCSLEQKVFDLTQMGDYKNARLVADKLSALQKALFVETNPIPIKYVLNKLGKIENEVRLPLVSLSDKHKKKLDAEVEKLI